MKTDFLKAGAASAMLLAFAAAPANAVVTFGDGGAQLQGVIDNITKAPVLGDSSTNVVTDQIGNDQLWSIGGSGGSFANVIIQLGSFATSNRLFGIYDATNANKRLTIFNGTQNTGSTALISILLDGSVLVNSVDTGVDFAGNAFGFYLDSSAFGGGGLFFSQTALNADQTDHMAAYEGNGDTIQIGMFSPGTWGKNEFIIAFEDLDCRTGCDGNYTDFVALVESINPVPEPGSLALLGLGMLGMGAAARRRKAG